MDSDPVVHGHGTRVWMLRNWDFSQADAWPKRPGDSYPPNPWHTHGPLYVNLANYAADIFYNNLFINPS